MRLKLTRAHWAIWLTVLSVTCLSYLALGNSLILPWQGLGDSPAWQQQILLNLRLPRAVQVVLSGGLLAMCGAAIQGLFRNPLAEPGLTGVSGGAVLMAAIALVVIAPLLASQWLSLLLPVSAFIGGIGATLLVLFITSRTQAGNSHFILTGVTINIICGAGVSLCVYVASDEQLRRIWFWQMGSFSTANWSNILIIALTCLPVSWLLLRQHKFLDVLLLGESETRHLGFDLNKERKRLIAVVAAGVAVAVCFNGLISFVGLIVPHMIRLLYGPSHKTLLPLCFIAGGMFLLLCDLISRTAILPLEMPIGIITAIIGGPFFLLLLAKQRTML